MRDIDKERERPVGTGRQQYYGVCVAASPPAISPPLPIPSKKNTDGKGKKCVCVEKCAVE